MISTFVDIVLTIQGLRNITKVLLLQVRDHHIVTLLHKIHHLIQTIKD